MSDDIEALLDSVIANADNIPTPIADKFLADFRNAYQANLKVRDDAVAIVDAIRKLTRGECTSVTIHNPNPDYTGPDYLICYHKDCEGSAEAFRGDTLLECLHKAINSGVE